ncbi:MAG TPA: glycosyltransferase family A protein [Phnomibacter sp.]|nr:glycosyltransferase family A protein [Phnomibacter sp.]
MKVSIIIPTYNYARYIGRAIQSVLGQTYSGEWMEIIVVDDGSTDDTAVVLQPFIEAGYIQYHSQPNAGKAAATQQGIELATGEFIFTLDADDWFLPNKIVDTVAVFGQYPQVTHVASAARIAWEDGRPEQTEPVLHWLLGAENRGANTLQYFFDNNLLFGGGSTYAVRTSAAKNFAWHKSIDMYTDEWLVIQALLAGNTFFIPEPASVWFVHSNNYSGKGGEALLQKQARLKTSSQCILDLLQNGTYPGWLKKTYRLKHAVRCIAWQEAAGNKTLGDAWQFLQSSILSGQHKFSTLLKYHAFNRLLKW